MQITPTPTDEEAAVIVAAVEALWPKPAAPADDHNADQSSAWRFSGRWWAGPTARSRRRP